jgi:hypothetical protein
MERRRQFLGNACLLGLRMVLFNGFIHVLSFVVL